MELEYKSEVYTKSKGLILIFEKECDKGKWTKMGDEIVVNNVHYIVQKIEYFVNLFGDVNSDIGIIVKKQLE